MAACSWRGPASVHGGGNAPAGRLDGVATFYYGFPFPNTAYAKLTNGVPSSALLVQGCYYFWNSLRVNPLTLPVIAAGLGVAFWQRKTRQVCIAAGILLYLVYLLRIGGDFMSGRYFTAPLLAALAILGSLDWRQRRAWGSAVAAIVLVGCCSIRPLAWSEKGFDMTRTETRRAIDAESGVCDERAYYFHSTGFGAKAAPAAASTSSTGCSPRSGCGRLPKCKASGWRWRSAPSGSPVS